MKYHKYKTWVGDDYTIFSRYYFDNKWGYLKGMCIMGMCLEEGLYMSTDVYGTYNRKRILQMRWKNHRRIYHNHTHWLQNKWVVGGLES